MAYVNRPAIVQAAHEVSTDELVAAVEELGELGSSHPLDPDIRQVALRLGVQRRRFARPLASVMRSRRGSVERTTADVQQLGERAVRQALDTEHLSIADLDGLIMFSTDARVLLGLSAHLTHVLSLPRSLPLTALAALGSAGGAQALSVAADDARLGKCVLVVGAEAPSSALPDSGGADGVDWLVARMLCSDGAAATLVSPDPLSQPSVYIEDVWQRAALDPGLAPPYPYRPETAHTFDASPRAVQSVMAAAPHLPPSWKQADFGLVHPGSTAQLDALAAGGCAEAVLSPARVSLAEDGNVGGTGLLHVLRRLHAVRPPVGSTGLLFASGPGFYAHAARVCWVAGRP
ncbi:hypothetical protein ABZ383_24445 [Streptomyces sp. NPDC005900]|uniref:hypothetical protein n=1 Tax=Streptomyces sp. NPDC005900 TaxID=3154569 RepID=UPI0033D99B91